MHKNVGSHTVGNGEPLTGFKEGHDRFSKNPKEMRLEGGLVGGRSGGGVAEFVEVRKCVLKAFSR